MSILGAVIRCRPADAEAIAHQLGQQAGLDLALNPGDGRMVVVIEDTEVDGQPVSAASTLANIATWPEVLGASLVYEYSGPDAPAPAGSDGIDYRAWRSSLADLAQVKPTPSP